MSTKKKITRSTGAQIKILVDYMSMHKDFANGEFTGPLGSRRNENEWTQLKALLAEHGPDKTVEQWKHTWRDLKKKAREDGGKSRRALGKTGNYLEVPELSSQSTKILDAIGHECALGIGPEETGISGLEVQPPAPFNYFVDLEPYPTTNTSTSCTSTTPATVAFSIPPIPISAPTSITSTAPASVTFSTPPPRPIPNFSKFTVTSTPPPRPIRVPMSSTSTASTTMTSTPPPRPILVRRSSTSTSSTSVISTPPTRPVPVRVPSNSSLRKKSRGGVPDSFLKLQEVQNMYMKDLCSLIKKSNDLKAEQIQVLKEQNRILQTNRTNPDVEGTESNSAD